MRTKDEVESKIAELEQADLDKMVLEEVEYGKFWLRWVLGKEKHTTHKRELTSEEQLRIANAGGQFEETGANSWVGTKVRKGEKIGVVTRDLNGRYRILTVKFGDGTEEEIRMNNIGPDPRYIHEYEWCDRNGEWYRF